MPTKYSRSPLATIIMVNHCADRQPCETNQSTLGCVIIKLADDVLSRCIAIAVHKHLASICRHFP